MTREELILMDKRKVRGNSNLMSIYKELYFQEFGKYPDCAGCTFSNDWERFVKSVSGLKKASSQTFKHIGITFELKDKSVYIFRYRKDGKVYRKYSNKLTENFAVEFLTHGTEQEISERKKLFKKLPEIFTKKPLTAEELIKSISDIADVNVLNEMLVSEERKTVKTAIKKRIKQL